MSYWNNETGNRWTTDCCARCGQSHVLYAGRSHPLGYEFVYTVCRGFSEPIPVHGMDALLDISIPPTDWRLDTTLGTTPVSRLLVSQPASTSRLPSMPYDKAK
jgi:hypothetical protein